MIALDKFAQLFNKNMEQQPKITERPFADIPLPRVPQPQEARLPVRQPKRTLPKGQHYPQRVQTVPFQRVAKQTLPPLPQLQRG